MCAAAIACCAFATGCETAKQIGGAAGEGVIQGFYNRVFDDSPYGGDSAAPSTVGSGGGGWGNAWSPSGRGVGVAPRGAEAPTARDCGEIADEFALYTGDTLRAVQTQVQTHNGELTRQKFEELSGAGTRLSGTHAGGVIAVAETSDGNSAKFVVQWPSGGDPQIVTVEVSNAAGMLIRSADAVQLQPRMALDLDSPAAGGEFDLIYGPSPNTNELTLAAAEGAGLSFAAGSLCQ